MTTTPGQAEDAEEAIFHRARALPPGADRAAFLARACGDDAALRVRVAELLQADAELGEFLREPVDGDGVAVPGIEGVGSVLDRYELVERIGEGGGGEVFRARPLQRDLPPVALKVLKAGMDTRQLLARFAMERRVLALMNHPAIARVMDAGMTPSGRPYFVMELVDGLPITAFADRHGLTVRERLELFRAVCLAVHHAHQKGVIHRDLKPSNVLVGRVDGRAVPKVIDFGIAKVMDPSADAAASLTRHGLIIGTPQYMSPEQAGVDDLDVDLRADIYALGVMLFELLTGSTPLDPAELMAGGPAGMRRLLATGEAPRPSLRVRAAVGAEAIAAARGLRPDRLVRTLAGELDWLVLKALDRDRERRYPSAWELAEDLRRHLAHEPVSAGPPSRLYRLHRFVRRNRLVVAASAAVAIALLVAIVGTSTGLLRANAARADLAQANARLQRVVDFQRSRLAAIDVQDLGLAIRQALLQSERDGLHQLGFGADRIAAQMAGLDDQLAAANFTSVASSVIASSVFQPTRRAIDRFADQPLLQATLLHSLASTMQEVGLLDAALEAGRAALAIRREHAADDPAASLESITLVGGLLRRLERFAEAAPCLEQAIDGCERLLGADHPLTLAALGRSASLAAGREDWALAEAQYGELIRRAERVYGPRHPDTLRFANNLGGFLHLRGRLDEATACYLRALDGFRSLPGDHERERLQAASNLSVILSERGDDARAEPLARETLEGLRREFGDHHPTSLTAMNALGTILMRQQRPAEALVLFEQALDGQRRAHGPAHREALFAASNVAAALRVLGRLPESAAVAGELVRVARAVLPADHWLVGAFLIQLGRTSALLSLWQESESTLLEGRRILGAALRPDHPQVIEANAALAGFYDHWNSLLPAEHQAREAARWRATAGGE